MHGTNEELPPSKNPLVRFQRGFEARFERFRDGYRDTLALALGHRKAFVAGFLAFVGLRRLLVRITPLARRVAVVRIAAIP